MRREVEENTGGGGELYNAEREHSKRWMEMQKGGEKKCGKRMMGKERKGKGDDKKAGVRGGKGYEHMERLLHSYCPATDSFCFQVQVLASLPH